MTLKLRSRDDVNNGIDIQRDSNERISELPTFAAGITLNTSATVVILVMILSLTSVVVL